MTRALLGLALTFSPVAAHAATLDLDPADPPRVMPADRRAEHGIEDLVFPDGTSLPALPAVVLVVEEGAELPDGAEPLGPTGRSWRVEVDSVADAVALSVAWRDRPGVQAAMPDLIQAKHQTFDDPNYEGQWYAELLGMEALWDKSLGDPDVRVAVLDSGIEIRHPDLEGAWIAPLDAYNGDEDPTPVAGDDHGTAVSGIITARANNGVGIVGFCPECTLIPIQILGDGGRDSLAISITAFEHAIAQDAAVINNSWGYINPTPVPEPLAQVIRRASTETRDGLGSVVIFAAGNDDRTLADNELQSMPEVLCVSATDRYGLPTNYTNEGAAVDIAAPSATVTLAQGGGTTVTFGGTSAAAPVVAGLAAWMISVDPQLSAEEVKAILIESAVPSPQVDHDADGHHPIYGYGEVSAQALLDHFYPPEPEPEPRACGCQSSWTGAPIGAAWIAMLVLWGRRRSG